MEDPNSSSHKKKSEIQKPIQKVGGVQLVVQDENSEMMNENKLSQVQQTGHNDLQKLIEEVTKKEEKWTKDQDDLLMKLVQQYKVENIKVVHERVNEYIDKQKDKVSPRQQMVFYQPKSEVDCMDRWLLLRNNTEDGTVKQIKGNWTPEEDMILKKKVAEYGLKKWKEIATFLPGRIGK